MIVRVDMSFLQSDDVRMNTVNISTHIGIEAKKHMDKGDLVPDEVMIQLVLNDVETLKDGGDGDDGDDDGWYSF